MSLVDLGFRVVGARAQPHAAQPTIVLTLAVEERRGLELEGLALSCSVRIEPQRRGYSVDEERRLIDLYGDVSRWSTTMRPVPWIETSLFAPAFDGQAEIAMTLPCSYDLEVSAAKYFSALTDGDAALRLLFRGTAFVRGEHGLEMTPLPWDREATWRLPVALWREAVDACFPDAGWLRLRKETIGALLAFKGRHALPSWDGVITTLLSEAER
ncbi:MAG TPA: DUF6084 family protein [Polyangia bacterium]|nr:DUF6084 family protein [Polyangia bacterium]